MMDVSVKLVVFLFIVILQTGIVQSETGKYTI